MTSEARSERLSQAVPHAQLGYPIPGKGPLGLVRRLLGRLLWPQMRSQVEFNRAVIEVLNALNDYTGGVQGAIANFENAFDNVDNAFIEFDRRARLLNERLDLVVRQSFVRYHEGVGVLQKELAEVSQLFRRALQDNERSSAENERALREKLKNLATGVSDVRQRVAQVDVFLNEVKRAWPHQPEPQRLRELPGVLANLYPSFEEAMRGPEFVIQDRARAYLDDIVAVRAGGVVLDLGCGRGEWLALLKEAGIAAYGIDLNEHYVAQGLARGLDIRLSDVREHLKGLPEAELKAISAIHLVEHLEVEPLVEILDLCLRALRPGGLLILETPNPENLIVGASSFYLDPTHVHPLPPQLLTFLVGARGFNDVEVRELKREELLDPDIPPAAPWAEDVRKLWDFLETRVTGPEDYAVLARRA